MGSFSFDSLGLDGVYLINSFSYEDNRGRFIKNFEKNTFLANGIDFNLNETFVSVSAKNVIRGMHFQTKNPQAKLVSVVKGRVWDVIIDLRRDSNTYKKWIGVELSAENHKSLFIPRGFAHGFVALEDETCMLYECDGAYDASSDTGIVYYDSEIAIAWPIDTQKAIVSKRDLELMSFSEYEKKYNGFKELVQ